MNRLARSRSALLIFACGIGCGLLIVSWIFQHHSWLSAILIEFGVTVFLFVPLLIVGRGVEERLDEVRSGQREVESRQTAIEGQQEVTSQQIANLSDDIERARSEMLLARDELADAVLARIAESRSRDAALFQGVERAPARETFISAIQRASSLGLIADRGARVLVVEPTIYARVDPIEDGIVADAFGVTLEDRTGRRIGFIPWNEDETAVDFLVRLASGLQAVGGYPGDKSFDATRLFSDFSAMFTMAHGRSADAGEGAPLKRIIEISPPQWAILEDGIICLDKGYPYWIEMHRIYESDWESHMRQKAWVEYDSFRRALTVARELDEERRERERRLSEPPF